MQINSSKSNETREAIEKTFRLAWHRPEAIPVAPWIVDDFQTALCGVKQREGSNDLIDETTALRQLAQELLGQVADFASCNGYNALLKLEARLGTLHDETLSQIHHHTSLLDDMIEIKGLIDNRKQLSPNSVIISSIRLHELKADDDRATTFERESYLTLGDHDHSPSFEVGVFKRNVKTPGAGSAIVDSWSPEGNLNPDYAPVPLDDWIWHRLENLDVEEGAPMTSNMSSATEDIKPRIEQSIEQWERRADMIRLRLSIVSAVKEYIERYGMRPEAIKKLEAGQGDLELVASDSQRVARRHIRLLQTNRVYVAFQAAELLHTGVSTWSKAYEKLLKQVKAWDSKAELAYSTPKKMTDAFADTYKVSAKDAREQGSRAFRPMHRVKYEAAVGSGY